jgi:dephospho-CoA kinase
LSATFGGVLAVGLTGGIGAGKSTVSAGFAARGAVVIDADRAYGELVAPGAPLLDQLVEKFGTGIRAADGSLDRPALSALVFSDPAALADLNAITHPAIGIRIAERMAEEAATDHTVILDVPLLLESDRLRPDLAGVIVVDAPVDVAVRRLVELRGMSEADARARIAAQLPREERNAKADLVIDNSGSLEQLEAEIDRAWAWIESLRPQ